MRFVDEYRDPESVLRVAESIRGATTRPWTLMEVCGGQTHAILAHGLDDLLGDRIRLLHGPGCPVCVTPLEVLDHAQTLAGRPEIILCSFGDMLRVPGSRSDLLGARARGGDVRVVYSPLDAVTLASQEPEREIVFLSVGFETTAPAAAAAARAARARQLANFSLLVSHVRVPPALEAILGDVDSRVEGFLAAGHVCSVMGTAEYEPIVKRHGVPIVVTGFEPLDIVEGVARAVAQLESGEARVEIQYSRAVDPAGNPQARAMLDEIFEIADRPWRGIGVVPAGGLVLRDRYADLDATRRFPQPDLRRISEPPQCRAGAVLRGALRPDRCPAFDRECTPDHPLGAPMVSSEGACAAYHLHRPEARS